MKVIAGVIGCGNIARFHFAGLAKCGAQIKLVCDISAPAAQPWADKFKATYTADYRELIADPAINTVVVTPISPVHKAICLAAIAAGKAVICEKTLAANAADAWEIIQHAEKKGTCFYTSYMKRFIPAVEKAKALLPQIGRILSTHIRTYQAWGELWDDVKVDDFFRTPPGGASPLVQRYGGGILVCGGSHILDLILFFLGRPRRLFASMTIPAGRDYDLQAAALLETDNGIVHYEALAHPLNRAGFLHDGWDETVEIYGTKGRLKIFSAAWDQVEHKASLLVHDDNAAGTSTEYRFTPCSPFDRAVAFYCANIAQGRQGAQSRLTGYEVDELIEHIKLSATAHQALEIKWRG